MTKHYLLVDDGIDRSQLFKESVGIKGELQFTVFGDPHYVNGLSDEDFAAFDGVISDFNLNPSTKPGYRPLMCHDPGWCRGKEKFEAGPVPVETGMGVLLHTRQRFEGMALFGLTEMTHKHAPMFLTAAQSWLGAVALNVDESVETLRRVLLSEDGEAADLQAAHRQMQAALGPFEELMNGCRARTPSETYDWLRYYYRTHEPRAHKQLAQAFKRDHVPNKVAEKLFVEIMRAWLPPAAAFVRAWGGDTSGWPDPRSISTRTLSDHNPFLDYLKDEKAFSLFFGAQDVRAALHHFRAREAHK